MVNKIQGIDYETALANLRASSLELRGDLPEKNELLSQFHPDYQANARVKLPIGPNQDDYCHPDLAKLLISQPLLRRRSNRRHSRPQPPDGQRAFGHHQLRPPCR